MSLDLHVYGRAAVATDSLQATLATVDGTRLVSASSEPGGHMIERRLRGRFEYLAGLDGPFAVEPEDLPAVIVANALGVQALYQLSVPATSEAGYQAAKQIAQALAGACSGLVYDPQLDSVTWPRGSRRVFDPPKATTVDVVEFSWYIRREDAPSDLPSVLLDRMERLLPEALPRRFGGYEPLQHRFDAEGRNGFIRCWQDEPSAFWKAAAKPCYEGSIWGLGREAAWSGVEHPVGTIRLSIDGRAFEEAPWRDGLVDFFLATAESSEAFVAAAEVARNLRLSGGSLSHGPEAESTWGPVVRGQWLGLPAEQPWLLWLNADYAGFLGFGPSQEATLLRSAERPPLGTQPKRPKRRLRHRVERRSDEGPVPRQARMTISGDPGRGGRRHRAPSVPDWL